MNEAMQQIADGLKKAIQAEGDGYHFYVVAAERSTDEQGKRVFHTLAQEELDHLRFLKAHYQSLLQNGTPDPQAKLGHRADLSGSHPIFSERLKSRIQEAHFEMSALSIGVQLEQNSMEFYRKMSETAQDPQVKSFFADLSEWERGHYEALLRQQEALRDDYWAAGGFSPF